MTSVVLTEGALAEFLAEVDVFDGNLAHGAHLDDNERM